MNHSVWEALASLCAWHNETMNVWTHLFGSLLLLVLLIITPLYLSPHGTDRITDMAKSFLGDKSSILGERAVFTWQL